MGGDFSMKRQSWRKLIQLYNHATDFFHHNVTLLRGTSSLRCCRLCDMRSSPVSRGPHKHLHPFSNQETCYFWSDTAQYLKGSMQTPSPTFHFRCFPGKSQTVKRKHVRRAWWGTARWIQKSKGTDEGFATHSPKRGETRGPPISACYSNRLTGHSAAGKGDRPICKK